jgi:hypothetical protein
MEFITLNQRELLRLRAVQQALDGVRTVAQAAEILSLSTRQVKCLTRRLCLRGAAAFASPQRGKPPNNAFHATVRERVLDLAQSTYKEFGPTFLAEKLAAREQLTISRETLRRWLVEAKPHQDAGERPGATPGSTDVFEEEI